MGGARPNGPSVTLTLAHWFKQVTLLGLGLCYGVRFMFVRSPRAARTRPKAAEEPKVPPAGGGDGGHMWSKGGSCIPVEWRVRRSLVLPRHFCPCPSGPTNFLVFHLGGFTFVPGKKRHPFSCVANTMSEKRKSKKSTFNNTTKKSRVSGRRGQVATAVAMVPAEGFATTGSRQRMVAVPADMLRYGGLSDNARGRELKFVDTALALTDVSTTPTINVLNAMGTGNSASTRVGRQIRIKSIEWKGYLQQGTSATYNISRHAIVLDRQANAVAPAFTDIYDAATPIALRNISNKKRFKVIWDSGLISQAGNRTAGQLTGTGMVAVEGYKRTSILVQYNAGTAGTVADITTNALYLVSIGAAAAGAADTELNVNVRIRFDDD